MSDHRMEPVQGVVFVLIRGGRVLMERCPKKAARHGGEWFLPGGRIEPGESALAALNRELAEELNIHADHVTPLPLVDATGGDNWGSFLMRPYRVEAWAGEIPGHCLDHPDVPLAWVPLEEARRSPTYAVRATLEAAAPSFSPLYGSDTP